MAAVSLRMDRDMLQSLKDESDRTGLGGSEIVRRALRAYFHAEHGASVKGSIYYAEYCAWANMIQRCSNRKDARWKNYGGRGIWVCAQWARSFQIFLADVGSRPTMSHSLDRIDNDGHYEPGNIRWATRKQQNRNRRSSRMIEYQGETLSVTEWAERTGIRVSTIRRRLDVMGWTVEEALTELPKTTWDRTRSKATKREAG